MPTTPSNVRRTYRLMAPLYDRLFRRVYAPLRRASIAQAGIGATDTVVLIGCGTGLDLPHLPKGATAIGVDFTQAMLRRARSQRPASHFVLADGARLPLRDGAASVVVLHLVLSVTPEPRALLVEAVRVLRPGGRVAVMDHFAGGQVSLWRRCLSRARWLLGTRFDVRVDPLLEGLPLRVVARRPALWGTYSLMTLDVVPATPRLSNAAPR